MEVTIENCAISAMKDKVNEETGEIYTQLNLKFFGGEIKFLKFYDTISRSLINKSGLAVVEVDFNCSSSSDSTFVNTGFRPAYLKSFSPDN